MASPHSSATSGPGAALSKRDGERRGLLDRTSDYKFWVLAAVLLLAFWSMLTASVTLKRLANGGITPGDSPDSASYEDLDILEIEAREKVVRHMWDVYTHSKAVGLPRFWQDAFMAGYESLANDVPGVRDAAVTDIAKMSLRSTIKNDPFVVRDMSNDVRATNQKLFGS